MTTPDTRPTIAPQVGKRYVMRNGDTTGFIRSTNSLHGEPFSDGWSSWKASGAYLVYGESSYLDLVAEYVEPAEEGFTLATHGAYTVEAPTIRQQFVMAAMQGILASAEWYPFDKLAELSCAAADACIAEEARTRK